MRAAQFCGSCGRPLVADVRKARVCQRCEAVATGRYCGACGHRVESEVLEQIEKGDPRARESVARAKAGRDAGVRMWKARLQDPKTRAALVRGIRPPRPPQPEPEG